MVWVARWLSQMRSERRLTFGDAKNSTPFSNVLVYVGLDRERFTSVFQAYGPVMQNIAFHWEYVELERWKEGTFE
jgi:hypothetical protein